MEPTKTEQLLIEARAICQRVTDRLDISDDLLCSVYRSLELEMQLQEDEPEHVSGHVH